MPKKKTTCFFNLGVKSKHFWQPFNVGKGRDEKTYWQRETSKRWGTRDFWKRNQTWYFIWQLKSRKKAEKTLLKYTKKEAVRVVITLGSFHFLMDWSISWFRDEVSECRKYFLTLFLLLWLRRALQRRFCLRRPGSLTILWRR